MTEQDFKECMAYLAVAVNKPLAATEKEAEFRRKVYFDLLGDLSAEVLQLACKRVALNHPWATFPSAAELRAAAVETMQGMVSMLSAEEAWGIAWKVADVDMEQPHSMERIKKIPPLVLKAINTFGLAAFLYCKDPVGVMRAQFIKIFDALAKTEKQRLLLPAALTKAIESKGERRPQIAAVLDKIGAMPIEH